MKKFILYFLGIFLTFNFLAQPAKSAENIDDVFICNLLYATIKECKRSASEKNIVGADNCNSLSLALMGAVLYTLTKKQGQPLNDEIIKISEILGKVCYKACIGEDKYLERIENNCK
jgi:hypothetical protein